MNNKISLPELVAGFSARQDIPKKKADLFVRTVFEIIQEYVVRDGQVKIKGLGTFKMISVESRESVNVNTQERIVIEGHSKITFTPDKALADQVNKPFAGFTTVMLNPGTSIEEMEALDLGDGALLPGSETSVDETDMPKADDLVPNASDEDKEGVAEPEKEIIVETETAEAETPAAEEEEAVETEETVESVAETAEEQAQEEISEPEPVEPEPVEEEPVVESFATIQQTETDEDTPSDEQAVLTSEAVQRMMNEMMDREFAKRSGNSVSRGWAVALIVAVLALAVGTFMMGYRMGAASARSQKPHVEVETPKSQPEEEPAPPAAKPQGEPSVGTHQEKPAQAVSKQSKRDVKALASKYEQMPGGAYLIVGTKAEHTMAVGDNLYKLARKHYGDNDMARYIIFYNKFSNPDKINLGQTIKLPELVKKD